MTAREGDAPSGAAARAESRAAVERRALIGSIVVTAALGVVGVGWGLASGSQAILFDGVYAFVGIAISWLLLLASSLAEDGPNRHYPYGREAATPLVIGVQGFVLLATLVYATVEAVLVILDGGSDVAAGLAIAYGALATVVSTATWAWVRSSATGSDLVAAEATAWRIAALRGGGMVIGFGIMWLLEGSSWDGAASYVDPTMVLMMCLAILPAPVEMVRTTIVELLEGAPPADVQSAVLRVVEEVRHLFGLGEPLVRMTKIGPKLYVEVDAVARPDVTITEEAQVRAALRERLDVLPYLVWLNFELRAEPASDV